MGKKINPQKELLTKYDLMKAEKKWQEQLAEMAEDATVNGELLAKVMIMLALKRVFGFRGDEFIKLFEEADRIGDLVSDTSVDYCIEDVCKELEPDVEFSKVEMWRNKWYKAAKVKRGNIT